MRGLGVGSEVGAARCGSRCPWALLGLHARRAGKGCTDRRSSSGSEMLPRRSCAGVGEP